MKNYANIIIKYKEYLCIPDVWKVSVNHSQNPDTNRGKINRYYWIQFKTLNVEIYYKQVKKQGTALKVFATKITQ